MDKNMKSINTHSLNEEHKEKLFESCCDLIMILQFENDDGIF